MGQLQPLELDRRIQHIDEANRHGENIRKELLDLPVDEQRQIWKEIQDRQKAHPETLKGILPVFESDNTNSGERGWALKQTGVEHAPGTENQHRHPKKPPTNENGWDAVDRGIAKAKQDAQTYEPMKHASKELREADKVQTSSYKSEQAQKTVLETVTKIEVNAPNAAQEVGAPGRSQAQLEVRKGLEQIRKLSETEEGKPIAKQIIDQLVKDGATLGKDAQGNRTITFRSGTTSDTIPLDIPLADQAKKASQDFDRSLKQGQDGVGTKFEPGASDAFRKRLEDRSENKTPDAQMKWFELYYKETEGKVRPDDK